MLSGSSLVTGLGQRIISSQQLRQSALKKRSQVGKVTIYLLMELHFINWSLAHFLTSILVISNYRMDTYDWME
jgi:hypothetical protein